MSQQESLAERAVRVLAKLATMTDDVTNEDADCHCLRNLKRIATQHLDAALREAEELIYLKESVRELRSQEP